MTPQAISEFPRFKNSGFSEFFSGNSSKAKFGPRNRGPCDGGTDRNGGPTWVAADAGRIRPLSKQTQPKTPIEALPIDPVGRRTSPAGSVDICRFFKSRISRMLSVFPRLLDSAPETVPPQSGFRRPRTESTSSDGNPSKTGRFRAP